MRSFSKGYAAHYRDLADQLEELTRLTRQGSKQNLALIEQLSQLTEEIRKDIGEAAK